MYVSVKNTYLVLFLIYNLVKYTAKKKNLKKIKK